MSSIWGNKVKISVFGESHGEAVGAAIDGLPSGAVISVPEIEAFLQRRSPRGLPWATARAEADLPRILSGLYRGRTTGTPLCAILENRDVRSGDYEAASAIPRPGHADLTAAARYSGFSDPRGGGHFSGRLTAPVVFAGAVCAQILASKGIQIFAHIDAVGSLEDRHFDAACPDLAEAALAVQKDFPVLDDRMGEAMIASILAAKERQDSLGGIVECMAVGIPAGLGDPIFDSAEARIASIVFGIPAVKGVEFGAGFKAAALAGSKNNDVPFFTGGNKTAGCAPAPDAGCAPAPSGPLAIRYKTNRAGGIEGGITNGMPILFRAAFKPTPSIAKEQESIDLIRKENVRFQVKGRHDPCIVPRAVPVVEAVCAIAVLDMWMEFFGEV